ncbi:MAG TPA: hypothetical protein VGT44_16050 [Ktedonobacteraceae bacterium]|nr:hypothetical protein [Ktedonobacteraceae bacterium]
MALTRKSLTEQGSNQSPPTVRRIWRTPGSLYNWLFLALSVIVLGWVYLFYRLAIATQSYPGPYNEPFRAFGIVSFGLVIVVGAYTLRRRFVRSLPGKVQNWLWLHIWLGVISILIAFMHDNFQNVTHDFMFNAMRFTEYGYGTLAMYALFVLVLTGVVGRLLDVWQARTIAAEADTNGVGISRSLEDRLFELSLAVGRLRAGKSEQFKQYCEEALTGGRSGFLPARVPMLAPQEVEDFQHTHELLSEYVRLGRSLQRQNRARLILKAWRYVHITLATLAFFVIAYHSVYELYKMIVLHY